jgi:hypothetical protein
MQEAEREAAGWSNGCGGAFVVRELLRRVIMTETETAENLPIGPLAICCPVCRAKPNEICEPVSGGRFEFVDVARVKAAARLNKVARKSQRK